MALIAPNTPLFVPAHRAELFKKAEASGADAVILDLEDAVSPDNKQLARKNIQTHGIEKLPVIVRINSADSRFFQDDVQAVLAAAVSGIMPAKAENPDSYACLLQSDAQVGIIPLIETAAGIANLPAILSANRVVCAAFGSLDYALDLGCAHTHRALQAARTELVLQSRLAGILPPIDGVTANFRDDEALRNDAIYAAEIGFGGKLAIHPRQTAIIHAAFLPSAEEIQWAQTVLAAVGTEGNVMQVQGVMVDAPVLARAKAILRNHACTKPVN